jgi:hypothetical protein
MLARPLLSHILEDDALTRGLGDPEARVLVEWLVEQAERLGAEKDDEASGREVRKLCRRARAIGRFVGLWCYQRERGAAVQLAAAERFTWPLPVSRTVDPCELMQTIVACEAHGPQPVGLEKRFTHS